MAATPFALRCRGKRIPPKVVIGARTRAALVGNLLLLQPNDLSTWDLYRAGSFLDSAWFSGEKCEMGDRAARLC